MKIWKKIAVYGLSLVLAMGTGALLAGCAGNGTDAAMRMQVDINPSVEFILDSERRVLSVTALNDDGSLIICGESFVGKTAEDAVELMVSISTETGYLVKGEMAAGPEDITISITGDAENSRILFERIAEKVDGYLQKSGIDAIVEQGEALKIDALRALVLDADPTVTVEEAEKMNERQLIDALKISRIETAQLITEELREMYLLAKEYDFRFAERQAVKDVIDGMGSVYESFLNAYSSALGAFRKVISETEQARYDSLVDASSDYQKALAEVRSQKDKVLAQRKEVAKLSEGAAKEAAENVLTELEKSFPEEVKSALEENVRNMENALNEAKDKAFAKFEEAHKQDIENIIDELETRKQKLIETKQIA